MNNNGYIFKLSTAKQNLFQFFDKFYSNWNFDIFYRDLNYSFSNLKSILLCH